jgi:hypothetical protein
MRQIHFMGHFELVNSVFIFYFLNTLKESGVWLG